MDNVRAAGTPEPDVSVVPATIQLAASLVLVKERGQSHEELSHERAASFAFGRVPVDRRRLTT
jgi:hypothetical protein